MKSKPARSGLDLKPWHPAAVIATGFGAGRLPAMPGSWGSLAALPFAWGLKSAFGTLGLAFAAGLAFGVGSWAAGAVAKASGAPDPGIVVIDEVMGQFLSLLPTPRDPAAYALAFLLFRLFDIGKPWPIGCVDRRIGGGFGIMLDDALAAVYALAAQLAIGGVFGVRP
ncbi:MAG TPA: phosphatidylglycerophosphatase A [Stellaceae bacterium]|nr:phosphatidylglycerophosphatase A [Stellaceae bacterium]